MPVVVPDEAGQWQVRNEIMMWASNWQQPGLIKTAEAHVDLIWVICHKYQ